jgi:hypothetical protein
MTVEKPAGDEHLGTFVYCKQHLRPHNTGWCTAHALDKIGLKATTREAAYDEVRANGWTISQERLLKILPRDIRVGDLLMCLQAGKVMFVPVRESSRIPEKGPARYEITHDQAFGRTSLRVAATARLEIRRHEPVIRHEP